VALCVPRGSEAAHPGAHRLGTLSPQVLARWLAALLLRTGVNTPCTAAGTSAARPTASILASATPCKALQVLQPLPARCSPLCCWLQVQLSCGEHTDYGLLTFVNQEAHMTALQVKNAAGQWISAPPVPGTFVCNIGDMLKVGSGRASSGRAAGHVLACPPCVATRCCAQPMLTCGHAS
jgi:hypothetical protein